VTVVKIGDTVSVPQNALKTLIMTNASFNVY